MGLKIGESTLEGKNYHSCSNRMCTGDKNASMRQKDMINLIVGVIIFAVAIIFSFPRWLEWILYLASYALIGRDIVLKAIKNIATGKVFDENLLMSIATIGAFAIGEFPEGVAVMLFYRIGEWLQDSVVEKSRRSIADLMDIRPDFANLKIGNDIKRVSPREVAIGHIIVVKPGEKIPLDGIVVHGESTVDTSVLTGESMPRQVGKDAEVLAGFINQNGVLLVEVTKDFDGSTASKILDLVENARDRKAPTERFITKFARYYTPVVVMTAVLIAVTPPLFIQGASFSSWVYRALVFLVVSCPCALVISIPLGFFGGIGGASKHGVLVKGGQYLEGLDNVDTVVFDKTGTLTKGVFAVSKVVPQTYISKEQLLKYAALAEVYSTHPIALSIRKAYGKELHREEIENYNEAPGHGVEATIKGKKILVGTSRFLERSGVKCPVVDAMGTIAHVSVDGQYAGYFVIADELKGDSADTVRMLKKMGVDRIVMLTGDNRRVGDEVAQILGMDEVYSELLPHEKVDKLDMLGESKTKRGKLVFVGDGINDAPVLARADVGVAMGALGSDAAIEAADVVLMTDQPSKLVSAMKIAKRTKQIVWQNIILALSVKGLVLILGALGIATMWEAVFADVGVAIIAVLNAMRVMRISIE